MSCLPSIWVCTAEVTPSKCANSVLVTSETVTLPVALDIKALLAVKSVSVIVEAPPVIVSSLLFIWVWTAEVTPSKYPSSVEVTSETAILPLPFETTALSVVKFDVVTVVAAPVIVSCLSLIKFVIVRIVIIQYYLHLVLQ